MKAKLTASFYVTVLTCLLLSCSLFGRAQEHLVETLEDTLVADEPSAGPDFVGQIETNLARSAGASSTIEEKQDDVASILQQATNTVNESALPQPKQQAAPKAPRTAATRTSIPADQSADIQEGKTALEKLGKRKEEVAKKKKSTTNDNDQKIEFHFEDADLSSLINQISELYDVTFITDDSIIPIPPNKKQIKGNKISFKTHRALTKKEAWNLFLVFLDIAGAVVIPGPQPDIYRIVATDEAKKSPIQSFIGVDPQQLPDNDQLIRYVYFVKNSPLETIKSVVESLRSSASSFVVLTDLNACIFTDRSYNIKSLMRIVEELDKVTMPQAMSVLKLQRVDAEDVLKLYKELTQQSDAGNPSARFFSQRRQPTALFFPENVRIITEPRSNSLILLGTEDAIKKIEDFIIKYVDIDMGKPYSPLRVYPLKYADCTTIANLMNEMVQFAKDTEAGKNGGVRAGDKYFKPMTFTPEPSTNRLIIRGDEEDYLKAKEILSKLDSPQPQVAVEVLIVNLRLNKEKRLGAQIRTIADNAATSGILGKNVSFQTSGININGTASGIVTNPDTNPGVNRLLGNLINLIGAGSVSNTIISLGSDAFGLWGILNVLETVSDVQLVANPFLVSVNKKPAEVSVGEIRRVISATVVGGATTENSKTNDQALLDVKVTPQINSDGMIVLDLSIDVNDYTTADPSDATKTTRHIETSAVVADKEVIAVGGLVKDTVEYVVSKVPILGDIPIIGWLFKNKRKTVEKNNLLILISTKIVPAESEKAIVEFTKDHITDYADYLEGLQNVAEKRDPMHRFFFEDKQDEAEVLDKFLFERNVKEHKKDVSKLKKKKAAKSKATVPETFDQARKGIPT